MSEKDEAPVIPEPIPNPDYYPVYPEDPGYYAEAGRPYANV